MALGHMPRGVPENGWEIETFEAGQKSGSKKKKTE